MTENNKTEETMTKKTETETQRHEQEMQENPTQKQQGETEIYEKEGETGTEKKGIFRKWMEDREESRDRLILSRIPDDQLMEYLQLEQKRMEMVQKAKEIRSGRILSAFQLMVSLLSVVAVTGLLKDNPTILVNILYIIGIVAALWIWKNPKEK